MPFIVSAAPFIGRESYYTIPAMIEQIEEDDPPSEFSYLYNPVSTYGLMPGEGAPVMGGAVDEVTRSVGMHTGGSVCFVNVDSGNGYVLHASSAHVPERNFIVAMNSINAGMSPYDNVHIAYAHPGGRNDSYRTTIEMFIERGIPGGHIVEITNLPIGMFGLNNNLQIGY